MSTTSTDALDFAADGGTPVQPADIDSLDFAKCGGLLPAVIQHAGSGAVLMLGYMNADSLRETFAKRHVVFFSRSKQRLWEKGETSGHFLASRPCVPIAIVTPCSSRCGHTDRYATLERRPVLETSG